MKKLFALLLALTLALSLGAVAFAEEETFTLTINNTTVGHTYDVYQIFTGDVVMNGPEGNTLSNLIWGYSTEKNGTKLTKDELEVVNAITDAEAFILYATGNAILENVKSTANSTVIEGLAPGYYFVKETSATTQDGEDMTKYILQIVGDQEVNIKAGKTTSDKVIDDINDSTDTASTTSGNDSADHDIGDKIPFTLTATVASDYANYNKGPYKLTFHDKMTKGLTFNAETVEVFVNGYEITTGYQLVNPATDGDTFDVAFANLKSITYKESDAENAPDVQIKANDVITVTFTATLNKDAAIGSAGNENTSHITYSNNPNDDQGGEKGTTPDDKVIAFTFTLDVNKVDDKGEALKGAGFTLYKKDAIDGAYKPVIADATTKAAGTTPESYEVKGENTTEFKWFGIDDGQYKLVETTTPAGYNTMDDMYFVVVAEHNETEKITALNAYKTDDKGVILTKQENDETVKVDAFTGNVSTGILSGNIINNAGSTLPETGGIGTTIFYVAGAVLVVGAAIILFAKKKVEE